MGKEWGVNNWNRNISVNLITLTYSPGFSEFYQQKSSLLHPLCEIISLHLPKDHIVTMTDWPPLRAMLNSYHLLLFPDT